LVELQPGETKVVTFSITNDMLEFYTSDKEWASEEGEFEVMIGTNSRDVKTTSFYLKK
jgi:beta-glucosidase